MGKNNKAVKAGLLGVIVGAVAGLLFAPKSGKETREDIKNAASKAARESEKKLKALYKDLSEKADELKKEAEELKGKAKKEAEDLSESASKLMARIKELITAVRNGEAEQEDVDKVVKEGNKLTDSLKKKIKK